MNRIFRGRRYDTETAQLVAQSTKIYGAYREDLYRKRTGEFFLHYVDVSKDINGDPNHNDKIDPLTFEEAEKWGEKNLETGDEYENIFGPVDEIGEKQTVSLSLYNGMVEKLKREASRTGCSASDIVNKLIGSIE